jgi:hypothetical protein
MITDRSLPAEDRHTPLFTLTVAVLGDLPRYVITVAVKRTAIPRGEVADAAGFS